MSEVSRKIDNKKVSLVGVVLGICMIAVILVAYGQISIMQKNTSALEANNSGLSDQVATLEAEKTSLLSQNAALAQDKANLQAQVTALQSQVAQIEGENANLSLQIAGWERSLAFHSRLASIGHQIAGNLIQRE